MKFGTAWIPLFGEIFAAVAVVLAKVPTEKNASVSKVSRGWMLAVFLSPPCPLLHRFLVWPRARPNQNWKSHKKTASYINAGYKICSLHFWSFGSFSWSFRGCVFVIKPRCTTRENELETEKKMIKTASYIYAGYKFVPYISGRLSLFLDPSEAVSLSSSLDAQREKMSWRLKKRW